MDWFERTRSCACASFGCGGYMQRPIIYAMGGRSKVACCSHSDKPGTSARVLYTHLPFRYPTQAIWLALSLSTPGGFSVDVAADQLQ